MTLLPEVVRPPLPWRLEPSRIPSLVLGIPKSPRFQDLLLGSAGVMGPSFPLPPTREGGKEGRGWGPQEEGPEGSRLSRWSGRSRTGTCSCGGSGRRPGPA
jgi:hypothetical protein